jgi:hypothetical protein
MRMYRAERPGPGFPPARSTPAWRSASPADEQALRVPRQYLQTRYEAFVDRARAPETPPRRRDMRNIFRKLDAFSRVEVARLSERAEDARNKAVVSCRTISRAVLRSFRLVDAQRNESCALGVPSRHLPTGEQQVLGFGHPT